VLRLRVQSLDGKPIAYANVTVDGGSTEITNDKGEVGLGTGRMQSFSLRVRRIGFSEWFGRVDVPDTASALTITMAHVTQQLSAVRVTGQKNPSSPFVQGFYDRWIMRQKGLLSAVFIGPEELEQRHPDKITGMLNGLNGVCMYPILPKSPVLYSSRAASLMAGVAGPCQNCPMAVLIDGTQQYGSLIHIDNLVDASDVMAIEVYSRGGNMPSSLHVNDNTCGVVALWTGSRH
jgi:hypothetical protein